jgi:hypothetical protein
LVKYWIISEPLVIKYDLSFITGAIQLSTNFLTVILVNVYLFSQGPYFGKNGPLFSDQVGPGPSTFKFLADLCPTPCCWVSSFHYYYCLDSALCFMQLVDIFPHIWKNVIQRKKFQLPEASDPLQYQAVFPLWFTILLVIRGSSIAIPCFFPFFWKLNTHL